MARMAALLLALACAAAVASPALGAGTIISLHKFPFFGGAEPYWIVPDPTSASEGAPTGCQNLPDGLTFESSRIYWNETAGMGICKFVWFFFDKNCTGDARGVEVIPVPQLKGVPWVSQDPILSRTTYWKIMNGKSVGCSFQKDPCEAFPCADPNAVCSSSWGWAWEGVANQQRNCSICKKGFIMGPDGKCATPQDACATLKCAAPSTCSSASGTATCTCPEGYQMSNATGACVAVAKDSWLPALNTVRNQAMPMVNGLQKTAAVDASPLKWDAGLAAVAKNWTLHLNETQCGQDTVALSKIPGSEYSESDVWVSWSSDESAAVQLWAPSPSDSSNPRTARITDMKSKLAGCAKTVCGKGAFFTCLFWPKTF